jgi:hypothetical protein
MHDGGKSAIQQNKGADVIEKYPGWRYHPTEKAKIIHSPEQESLLGEGWSETPFSPPVAPAWNVREAPAPLSEPDPNANTPPPADDDAIALADARAERWYGMSTRDAIERIARIESIEDLRDARSIEAKHPRSKGGRRPVLKAIGDRFHDLLPQGAASE